MSFERKPVITSFPCQFPPQVPPDLKVTSLVGPDTPQLAPNCPVVAWNEYVYWPYSYIDNRVGMGIVAYEENGTMVKRWDKSGARYVYKITSDEKAETLTFWGQADETITISWSELYLMIPPFATKLPADVHPPVPEGLKVACMLGPDTLDPSPTCPVIQWNNHTYWPFSYIDNRYAMNIVAYDAAGKIVKQWDGEGARYVYKITIDPAAQTVTFWGQADKTIVMKWTDLALG